MCEMCNKRRGWGMGDFVMSRKDLRTFAVISVDPSRTMLECIEVDHNGDPIHMRIEDAEVIPILDLHDMVGTKLQ